MNLVCNGLSDALTIVTNSGVVDWDWGDERNPLEVLDNLATYIWNNCETGELITDERFDELLKGFIQDILKDDPSDYSL